jgi:hypothetical protein
VFRASFSVGILAVDGFQKTKLLEVDGTYEPPKASHMEGLTIASLASTKACNEFCEEINYTWGLESSRC